MRKPRLFGLLTACLMLPAFASAQTYSISGITPLDFSKNSSYQVTTGGGAQLFQPVLKFASSTGTVGTITRNPACSDNITLQHSGSSEPLEVPIYANKQPEGAIFTVTEEETEDGKYAIFTLSNAYAGQTVKCLDSFNVNLGFGISYKADAPELIFGTDGSIKINRLINDGSYFVFMPEASAAAVDAYGNWTFNAYTNKTISCELLISNGLRYETVLNTTTYESDAYITGVVKDYFTNGIITIPEYFEGKKNYYGTPIYNIIGIRANAFKNAGDATTVILNNNLETIASGAFTGASNVDKIVMPKVTNFANGSFNGVNANCKIYVPAGNTVATIAGLPVQTANIAHDGLSSLELNDGLLYVGFAEKDMPVTYKRAFSATNWEPLFVPVTTTVNDFLAHGKVAKLVKAETDGYFQNIVWKQMEAGETLEAHTPYLFLADNASTVANPHAISMANATVKTHDIAADATVASDKYTMTLTGTYIPLKNLNGSDNYSRKFYLEEGNYTFTDNAATELSPMRFFVTLKKNGASADDNVVLRNIVLDENDMPTVVEGLGMDVLMPDTYYDLNGRRVVNPEKGIFILNGKKVVVK